jgi:hypothetical protein
MLSSSGERKLNAAGHQDQRTKLTSRTETDVQQRAYDLRCGP